MSKIGLGQFLKNVFDYSTGKQPTQQPGQVANENFQKAQNDAMRQLNQTAQNIAQNFVRQQDVMITQMQLREFTQQERAMLLKQLFDFPSNIKDIATFLATENKVLTAKELQLLMLQPLDISKLTVLLQTNGKGAMEKLAKMVATMHQSGIYDTKQLKEMVTLVNACIPASDASATQVIKNLMIMYLPWLPLNGPVNFEMAFGGGDDDKNSEMDDSISVIITTKNFGIVKIFIFNDSGKYNIDLNCSEEFPKAKFNNALKIACEITSVPIDEKVIYTNRKTSDTLKNSEINVEFAKAGKISPQLLMVVYSLINIVIELDNNCNLD